MKKLNHIVIGDNWIPHLPEQSLIYFLFLTERENAATTGAPTSSPDGNTKSGKEGGRGGRKKYVTHFGVSMIHFLIAYHVVVYVIINYPCPFQHMYSVTIRYGKQY